ncbi:hypothetical protein BJX99DRAFT_228109 [Aspergillus californicus]
MCVWGCTNKVKDILIQSGFKSFGSIGGFPAPCLQTLLVYWVPVGSHCQVMGSWWLTSNQLGCILRDGWHGVAWRGYVAALGSFLDIASLMYGVSSTVNYLGSDHSHR